MAERKKVFITRHLPEEVESRAKRDYEVVRLPEDRIPDTEELLRMSSGCDAILCCITEKFTADVIGNLPETIKIISTFSVGTDHIDLEAARSKGIRVGCAPNGVTISTAEIAMTLIMATSHRAHEGNQMVREQQWQGWAPQQLLGVRLLGKRLGIFGMGKIGQAIAQRARAFGMEIHYHNRNPLDPEQEQGAVYHNTLDGLLAVSDILSINAPSTPETRHIIDVDAIAKLPDNAIIINTARGDLVNDNDLIEALKDNRLFAAGLDVYEGEPDVNKGYLTLPNAFLLPHLGSGTLEARIEMGFEALDNIDAVLAGKEPVFKVV